MTGGLQRSGRGFKQLGSRRLGVGYRRRQSAKSFSVASHDHSHTHAHTTGFVPVPRTQLVPESQAPEARSRNASLDLVCRNSTHWQWQPHVGCGQLVRMDTAYPAAHAASHSFPAPSLAATPPQRDCAINTATVGRTTSPEGRTAATALPDFGRDRCGRFGETCSLVSYVTDILRSLNSELAFTLVCCCSCATAGHVVKNGSAGLPVLLFWAGPRGCVSVLRSVQQR